MIPALSFDELSRRLSERYEYGERRIIGLMLARYDIPIINEIISSCYQYWHKNSGRDFDLFWAGYGEYLWPDKSSPTQFAVNFHGNSTGVYFDLDAFISCKTELNQHKKLIYKDKFELILLNFYDGKIHFDEHVRIDLEKNLDEHYASIREVMEYITDECRAEHDVVSLNRKLLANKFWDTVKGVKFSDVVNTALGIVSVL
ncbi:hypothetical protein acsn021_41380 [Anaerocolumna cellulosilytica]|uniref:Uncharacterized protein n=1 Tax=Anaerocolumna cellulosilytica TaxID=433286 RepID=A0A6S6R5F4_9FIRM|nr:hypothetical protein [Anaerocolumna cellulosilytica]MBB5197544.1 hypothetical protein [Anaerocolumna cellulosilytica]BCJ96569.1 hypothetical protein acsn021_41380 [Anaerocolumna cellulosilytica]